MEGNGISQMEISMLDLQLQLYPTYTLSNGCSDTILVNVDGINVKPQMILYVKILEFIL